jgi:RNase P subunit RPR2
MDQSITITITAGPFVATHEDTFCPVCQEPLLAGDPAITLDEGYGPVTTCRRCGTERIMDLLGEWRPWGG